MSPADDLGAVAAAPPPFKPLPQKAPDISVEKTADGTYYVRSNHPPAQGPRSVAHLLAEKAAAHPDRPYILQRAPGHGPWGGVTYGQAKRAADGIAQWLLSRGLTGADSVMVLSANSVEHALVMLGCYTAGVPIAPISPAYSLISTDHAKLKHCFATVKPKVVFAQNSEMFARAFETLRAIDPTLTFVTVDGANGTTALADLTATEPTAAVEAARETLSHSTVAKYLFTSGSTGMPKGVPQTHGMFAGVIAGTEGLRDEPADPEAVPQGLEWMPWSHISAGNIGFNGAMWAGATLHLDEGKPIPGMFETTIKNLTEISPMSFGSAPVAFGMLAEAMERDPALRKSFFKNLRSMGYGGATLSTDVSERLQALAIAETGFRVPLVTMYGATETQGITVVHWITELVGLIGLPLPGITLKLVPNGTKLEVRVKGPTVTTGYHNDPEKTAAAFDEEGFYKLGDACRFLDPEHPELGLVFDGRVTEDFKLDSGTWVSVGTLRPDLVAACTPYAFDMVVAGQDKPFAGALIWPSPAALPALGENPIEKLKALLRERIGEFNATAGGSSRRVGRFILMLEPPSIDAGEITDKGYVNQRATLERRHALVQALYANPPGDGVVVV
ncbi:MAG: AMP-binding protein [Alphaproteobacteria bacterium]|nr:AMP-binding protein [Alphaproteobacteria bacterium]MBU1514778.1 AMP-binding protein [Alphaproteobacteria bacterium]MBU2093909.1 AMP-binding protein [Alphaproteobacteria bacterium]MBU2153336.1 AMP-binding protein [Alphaproteobacteria bacterium]MBU2309764.1 AMP-binding protein [Alphaproteobacteria bacterium]